MKLEGALVIDGTHTTQTARIALKGGIKLTSSCHAPMTDYCSDTAVVYKSAAIGVSPHDGNIQYSMFLTADERSGYPILVLSGTFQNDTLLAGRIQWIITAPTQSRGYTGQFSARLDY